MKTCGACKLDKPEFEYSALPHTRDRLNWRCRSCQSAYCKQRRRSATLERLDHVVLSRFDLSTEEARLWKFVRLINRESSCWRWIGSLHPESGYGRFWFSKHDDRSAHRVAYEWSRGSIPSDLCIDHLCRNRWCVNPDHMELVTPVENVMRGESAWAINARKTHCLRGHAFTPENTYLYKGRMRHCMECARLRKRARRLRAAA